MEAGAAMLGGGLVAGNLDCLRGLLADVFGMLELEQLVDAAVDALREGGRHVASSGSSSSHWLDARAGELTTWIILFGAVEQRRRTAHTPDLERTAAWVRSLLDGALSATRSGPPPEVRLGAEVMGDAGAGYGSALGRFRAPPRRSNQGSELRAWAVSWLAQRLRLDESRVDPKRSFADHGVDSLAAVEFAKALADRVDRVLDETLLWNFPTIDALLEYLETPVSQDAGASSKAAASRPAALQPAAPQVGAPQTGAPAAGQERRRLEQPGSLEEELERLERELAKRS